MTRIFRTTRERESFVAQVDRTPACYPFDRAGGYVGRGVAAQYVGRNVVANDDDESRERY